MGSRLQRSCGQIGIANMTLFESKLPDLLIDLHDQYGSAFPKPQGQMMVFEVIHESATWSRAKAEIEALLALHGISATRLEVKPGPEVKGKFNRRIHVEIPNRMLMPSH